MLMNPILVVCAVALVGFGLIYCVVNRPKLPVLTLLFLIVLIVFLIATTFLNSSLETSSANSSPFSPQAGQLIAFLTGVAHPTQEHCEQAFRSYQIADMILFAGTLIAMATEIWRLLIKPSSQGNG